MNKSLTTSENNYQRKIDKGMSNVRPSGLKWRDTYYGNSNKYVI